MSRSESNVTSKQAASGKKEEKTKGSNRKTAANTSSSSTTDNGSAKTAKRTTKGRKAPTKRASNKGKSAVGSKLPSKLRPDNKTLVEWYKTIHMGRILDEKAANYLKQAKGWSYHAPCAGHEGIQFALGHAFRAGHDYLFPYYRDLLTSLAAGLTPYEIVLNGLSKDEDVAGGGRHMSNHFAKPELHIQNVSSCTGNQSLHAVGLAKAIKTYESDAISFYSGGESACSEGYFYEAVHGAATGKFPVVFVIQNNGYGISVPIEEVSVNPKISDNFTGFPTLKIIEVDGTDVLDSWRGIQEALEYIKSGKGPAMVHAQCVRIGSHSNSDRHDLYRSPEELEEVKTHDPVKKFREFLLAEKVITEKELEELEKKNREEMLDAADRAEATADPDPKTYHEFLMPEPYEADEKGSGSGDEMTLLQALNTTLRQEFEHNPDTYMWGQDMANKEKGGVFNVTKGLQQAFGYARVHNAPIAEDFIVGTANGFSRFNDKIRLVVEGAEFADYYWPAMEQTVEMGHEYWRTRGQFSPNVTIRIPSGGYISGGLYHSQNIEASLLPLPGMRIVYPAFADDAAGLMRTCMRSRGMNIFLEPKFLYNHGWAKTQVPEGYEIPFGKARTRREGKNLAIVTYGTAVHLALQAAEKLSKEGIEAEVLDLRSLRPLDEESIYAAVKKTNRVLVAHEDNLTGGIGGEIASLITSNCFRSLDAPVMRVASKDTPVGFSHILEKAVLLNADDVYQKAKELMEY